MPKFKIKDRGLGFAKSGNIIIDSDDRAYLVTELIKIDGNYADINAVYYEDRSNLDKDERAIVASVEVISKEVA